MTKAEAHRQRRATRKARRTGARQAQRRRQAVPINRGTAMVRELYKTVHHFFPELFEHLRQLEDCRAKSDYTLVEVLLAAILLFVFKQGSRNAFNNKRQEGRFRKHYGQLFKRRLPHLDTVHRVLCQLAEEQLEQLLQRLVKTLLEKKVLHQYRLFKRYFVVAIDATGVMSFTEQHCEHCLHRTSKTGKTSYFHPVLEAKLVTPNGLAISLASEWMANPEGEYDKQDCERKAFVRLAATLKQRYPRLPICLTADGLYPYQGFFEICQQYGWAFIVTFQEGNLPSVWEEVRALQALGGALRQRHERRWQGHERIEQVFEWVNDIDYHGHRLDWLSAVETRQATQTDQSSQQRFVHLTNLSVELTNVATLSASGRLRWKIENEGFNTQKHHGYALQHKYARVSWRAAKNYYQCLQIGHLINQLMVLSRTFQPLLQGKMTLRHLWQEMMAFLTQGELSSAALAPIAQRRCQVRLL